MPNLLDVRVVALRSRLKAPLAFIIFHSSYSYAIRIEFKQIVMQAILMHNGNGLRRMLCIRREREKMQAQNSLESHTAHTPADIQAKCRDNHSHFDWLGRLPQRHALNAIAPSSLLDGTKYCLSAHNYRRRSACRRRTFYVRAKCAPLPVAGCWWRVWYSTHFRYLDLVRHYARTLLLTVQSMLAQFSSLPCSASHFLFSSHFQLVFSFSTCARCDL